MHVIMLEVIILPFISTDSAPPNIIPVKSWNLQRGDDFEEKFEPRIVKREPPISIVVEGATL
jgi:hypothetical protein